MDLITSNMDTSNTRDNISKTLNDNYKIPTNISNPPDDVNINPEESNHDYTNHTELLTFIFLDQWSEASDRIKTHPSEVRQFHTCFLPISHAIRRPDVPLDIISQLINSYPESLSTFDVLHNRLPLHWSLRCKSPNIEVLKLLINFFPEAIMKQDKDGQSPLVYHFWFSNDLNIDVIQLFVNKNPKLLELKDHYQWLPLHHAVKHGKWYIIKYIIDQYPKALFEVDMIGLIPRLYADREGRNKGGIWDKVLKEEHKWYEVIKEKRKKKENEYDFTYIGSLNNMKKDYIEKHEENRDKYMINMAKDLNQDDMEMFESSDSMNEKKYIKTRDIKSSREEKFINIIDNITFDKKNYHNNNVENRIEKDNGSVTTENKFNDMMLDETLYIDDTIKENDISNEDLNENIIDITNKGMNKFIKEKMGLDDKIELINNDVEEEENYEEREKYNKNEKERKNNDKNIERNNAEDIDRGNVDNINIDKNENETSENTDNNKHLEENNVKNKILEKNDLDEDLEEYDISAITDGWEEDVEAGRTNDSMSL